jgi:23S rRNA (pseudouridine1915-N3)-methyltransferase
MRISLLAVGRTRDKHAAALCADYASRIPRFAPFSVEEVKDGRGRDERAARQIEGERILARLPPGARCVLLDEFGTRRTSVGLAEWLTERQRDTQELRFVLGGAFGFDDAVKSRVTETLRLSDMTLPHELARVMFLEQLYRALSIQAGRKYHHGTPDP